MGNENHDKGKSVEQGTDSGIGGRIEVETVNQRVSHPKIVIHSGPHLLQDTPDTCTGVHMRMGIPNLQWIFNNRCENVI